MYHGGYNDRRASLSCATVVFNNSAFFAVLVGIFRPINAQFPLSGIGYLGSFTTASLVSHGASCLSGASIVGPSCRLIADRGSFRRVVQDQDDEGPASAAAAGGTGHFSPPFAATAFP